MTLCDHIREDAYECVQNAKWSFSPEDEPYVIIHSCNDHLSKLLPRTMPATVYYDGDVRYDLL